MNRKWEYKISEYKVEYAKYSSMIYRTNLSTKNKKVIKNYLNKGITCCEEWKNNFDQFVRDMGRCPEGYELDRRDNDKGYYKENCRWVSRNINQHNRRKLGKSALPIGVKFHIKNSNYTAQICVDYIAYHIGSFSTIEEAQQAYDKVAVEWYGFTTNKE